MAEKFRVTYATMSADNEELQSKYDEAAERMKGELGKEYPFVVNGEERWTDEKYEEPSPIDSDIIIGRFSQATPKDVDDAVAAAKAFQLEWDRMGWQARVEIMRNVADIMEDRLFDLAALMAYEVGKSRLEALGDVQETAELIRWNADEMDKHEGFRTPDERHGRGRRLLRRPSSVRRVGGHQPVQLPDGALGRAVVRARSWPATPWC